jgi:hypothetical protein
VKDVLNQQLKAAFLKKVKVTVGEKVIDIYEAN